MRARIPQRLGDVLGELIRRSGMSRGINEAEAVQAWNEIANPPLQAVTERVWVRGGVMHVKITNSTWRQELHFESKGWCDKVNEKVGKKVITSIEFR